MLNVRQMAARLQSTEYEVRKLCRAGTIPAVNTGTWRRHVWKCDEGRFESWRLGKERRNARR